MFKETARVRWYDETIERLRIDCPETHLNAHDDCIFHNPDLFDAFVKVITHDWKLGRMKKVVVTLENDTPVINITANFPSFMTTETIKEMISAFRLPRLKTICRKLLFEGTSNSHHELCLFKALLRRKYDIPAAELDTIETQTNLLLK